MKLSGLEVLVIILTILKVGWSKKFDYPRAFYWSRSNVGPLSSRSSQIGPVPLINEVIREWSNWSSWNRCSRTCGGGVTSRTRFCITKSTRVMPGSGIRTTHSRCTGDGLQHRICSTSPCPVEEMSALYFRDAQCRIYNNRRVLGRIVNNWIPYKQIGMNPCALVCEGKGEGIVYTFGKVTDGTYCNTEGGPKGLCVNGRCLKVACDGSLGGNAQEDMCRVCKGNNETCTKYSGIYLSELPSSDQPSPGRVVDRTRHFGYFEVAEIPRGSTNIKVFDNSSNFIALKSNDKYLLNGNWLIDWPGDIEAAGTTFSYSRKEDQSELLTSVGPTHDSMMLMVLLKEHNPGIRYEYWTPKHTRRVKSFIPSQQIPANLISPSFISQTSNRRVNKSDSRQYKNYSIPNNQNSYNFKNKVSGDSRRKYETKMLNEIFHYKNLKTKKKKHYKNRSKSRRKGCKPCNKIRGKESFCKSDFVSKVKVISRERLHNQSRVTILVLQSYKNLIPLLHKEYIWQDACSCRTLRPNRTYVVMGMTRHGKGREVRLILDRDSYIRKFSAKVLSRVTRLRENEMKICRKWRKRLGRHRLSSRNYSKSSSAIASVSLTG